MVYDVTQKQLANFEPDRRRGEPHVVILGAGASVAAFPKGDANGRRLPLMPNLVDILELRELIEHEGHNADRGFEELFSSLATADPSSPLVIEIERRVREFFSILELPEEDTLYDCLLLSLREKDAIFTFNWDPFLVGAWIRQSGVAPLPHIFHLHGNVHVNFCPSCQMASPFCNDCPECGVPRIPTKLLYPVAQKNYSDDLFISHQWNAARHFIRNAGIITIFGYSAPQTDKEAMEIFTNAWKGEGEKALPHLEIIDTKDEDILSRQWWNFSHFGHIERPAKRFEDSLLARYPRRTSEFWHHKHAMARFVEPTPWSGNYSDFRTAVQHLIDIEQEIAA